MHALDPYGDYLYFRRKVERAIDNGELDREKGYKILQKMKTNYKAQKFNKLTDELLRTNK